MLNIIEKSFDSQVQDLQELIRIPSVSRGEPREGMPYGEHVFNALRKAQEIARKLGFEKVWDVEALTHSMRDLQHSFRRNCVICPLHCMKLSLSVT